MTTYTFDLGAGGTRVLALHKNTVTLDGETITQAEAVDFFKNANTDGIPVTSETRD